MISLSSDTSPFKNIVASFRENGTRLFKFRLSLFKIFGPFKLLSRIEEVLISPSEL